MVQCTSLCADASVENTPSLLGSGCIANCRYVTAVAAGGPSWSGAYIFASTGAVGNTFAVPVFDSVTGELVYVIGVDLSLDTISDVLYDLSAANPSDQVAYAMDGSGFLYVWYRRTCRWLARGAA